MLLMLFYLCLSLFPESIQTSLYHPPTAPLVGAALLTSPGRPAAGVFKPFSRALTDPGGWAGRTRESGRDGGLEDAYSFSQGVDTLTHLPDRSWLNKLIQVTGMIPFRRERGSEKGRRKRTGKGRTSLCAPEPGRQKGAGRSGLGDGNVPPPDRESAQHPFPAHRHLPPLPASATGFKRQRRGTREVCGNFYVPGAAQAPGRSS